jgi:nucleoside-diphosphate-sugar epimerase
MTRKALHILVTGTSGFVGQALARLLVAKGHSVTALVRAAGQAPEGCDELVHPLGQGAALVLPEGVNAVAHLAQSRAYRAFPGDAEEMFRVNVTGAHELLQASARAKISRFCLVSSGTVYEPFEKPMTEDAALCPPGNLGATKLASEIIAQPYGALFPLSILRLFAPYGPGQTARLVPDLLRRVREGVAVTLPETGGGMRFTPTYVDDVCEAMIAALEDEWSGVFNIASPEALTIKEAVEVIGEAIGREPVIERKQGGAPILVPDISKLGRQYDLARFRSFADGIAAMLAQETLELGTLAQKVLRGA